MKLLGRPSFASSPAAEPAAEILSLPYAVRRGRALVACFAQRSEAANWARDFSNIRDTDTVFYVYTLAEIICAFRDGAEVEVP